MKIRKVEPNNRKGEFHVSTYSGAIYACLQVKTEPQPDSGDKVADACVDRELARRLKTSVPQLYRLPDKTNTRKSDNQLICLLRVLDCSVDLVVTDRKALAQPGRSDQLRDSSWDRALRGGLSLR